MHSSKTWTKFNERSVCAGNYLQLFILPDGNVTICEELYWHPKFIVGNILEQSLNEIWNSKAALNLYYLKQSDISEKVHVRLVKITKYVEFRNKYVIGIL